jgi:hypothetical protein
MKIKAFACLSGYSKPINQTIINIDDEDIEGMTEDEKEVFINDFLQEWYAEQLDSWYEIVEE